MENENSDSVFVDSIIDFCIGYYDKFGRMPQINTIHLYFTAELEKNLAYILEEAEADIDLFSYDLEE